MNRPSPELVACMLQAHEEFARRFTSVDSLAELADAGPDDIRRVVTTVVESACDEAVASTGLTLNPTQRKWMATGVLDEAFGSGPLEPLLRDENSDAILILGPRDVCLERDGQIRETEVVFADEQHIQRLFELRAAIKKFLQRVPSADGPTWRIDLRGLRQRVADVTSGQAPADDAVAPQPSTSSARGFGGWLARLFG
jgi:hypothetical protein